MQTNGTNVNFYRLCPQCGNFSHIVENQSFCILCGTKLIEECMQCAKPILHPQGKFCYHCGASYRFVQSERRA